MKVSEIQAKLDYFIKNKQYQGMLIDGDWGIGKTYQLAKFFEEIKKDKKLSKKIHYFSIYGTESLNDFNEEVYCKLHPYTKMAKNVFATVSATFNAISGARGSSLKMPTTLSAFESTPAKKEKIDTDVILIIDDVERFGSDNFGPFLGLLNKYYLEGARVVCICSFAHLGGDRLETLNAYKEKMFDLVYKMDEPDYEIFDIYFQDITSTAEREALLTACDNNLRTLIRASRLLAEIKKAVGEIDEGKMFLYAIVCCYAVRIALGNYEKKQEKESEANSDTSARPGTYRSELANKCGETVGRNFDAIKNEWKNYRSYDFRFSNVIYYTILFFFLSDERDIIQFFRPYISSYDSNDVKILKGSYFCLSDAGKKKYIQTLEKSLKDPDTPFDSFYNNKLGALISAEDFAVDEELICAISDKLIKASKKGNLAAIYGDFIFTLRTGQVEAPDSKKRNFDAFRNAFEQIFKKKLTDDFNNMLSECFARLDDSFVRRYNEGKKYLDSAAIKSHLVLNGFFLPDLQGEIEMRQYEFASSIASLSNAVKAKKELKSKLLDMAVQDESDLSCRMRIYNLIRHNLLDRKETYDEIMLANDISSKKSARNKRKN